LDSCAQNRTFVLEIYKILWNEGFLNFLSESKIKSAGSDSKIGAFSARLQLDELISSLQAVYCDIFSNRELSVEGILNTTPRIALLTAVIKDQYNFTDI